MDRTIIAVNGVIGSGKNQFSQYFVENGFESVSFAGTLKDAVSVIFGWDREMLEGTTDASRIARDQVDVYWSNVLGISDVTPRWILQNFGTDCVRRHFNDDIWVHSLVNKINKSNSDKVIITDCRFPNELNMVRAQKGYVIEVQRVLPEWYSVAYEWNTSAKIGKIPTVLENIHVSEWAWIGINKPDYTVQNNGTLDDLRSKAITIMSDIQ